MEIRPLDLSSDADVLASWAVVRACRAHDVPGATALPADEHLLSLSRQELADVPERTWVAERGGDVVGVAKRAEPQLDPDIAHLWVDVHPQARRSGIGSALADVAEAGHRPVLHTSVALPAPDADDVRLRFALRRGYAVDSWQVTRRLTWPPPPLPTAPALAPGYEVTVVTEDVPPELDADYRRLRGLVNAEAPSGSLAYAPRPVSRDEMVAERLGEVEAGIVRFAGLALTGAELVALSEVRVPRDGGVARGGVTIVDARHRGRGLGLAVKRAWLRALVEAGIAVDFVSTRNDQANRWMIAINEVLGFRVHSAVAELVRRRHTC